MAKINLPKKVTRFLVPTLIVVAMFFYFNRRTSVTAVVTRVQPENRIVKRTISASGYVKSSDQVDLSFLAAGEILKINVEENETVKKGQLLAYLDSSAQAQTVQAYKDARDIRIRQKEIFEEEEDANEDLLGGETPYEIKLREYGEYISQAEANYQAQLSILSNYYIYAPFDGTIISISKKEGETSTAGVPVMTIANLDDVIFEVILDQEDYSLIQEGQEADIELDAYGDDVFLGRVKKLPLYADQSLGGFVIENTFETNGKTIKIGMTGDSYIVTDKTDGEVPALVFNEISYDEEGYPFVWIVEDGKLNRLPIEIGLEGDVYIEVRTDLKGKEIVVPANDNANIKEGFRPKIIN
jgi:RND family efflux transporter MFP subunit